jgi:acetylornithine/N-succinyldiaminopimelate aminotransferase
VAEVRRWAKLTHPDLGKIVPDPAQPRSFRSGAVVEERAIYFVEGLVITAVMPTYGRKDVVFERGEGNYLYAADGRRYLDFTSGIAVNALGHCHPYLVKALTEQGQKLWHTSNLFRVGNGEKLAKRLVENSFADTMFFCNSGAEAIEGGIKLIRKYQFMNGQPKRYKLICFQAAFHGRLLNALSATGNEKYLEGFGPPAPGYKHAPLNNTNVVRDMIDDETAGILVEPIQGEGGIRATTTQFLKDLRSICDEFGLLLFYDEIHTGFGRTGKMWGYDWSGVKPDVAAIAKGMGGGFPIGAFMATEKAAVGMVPGTHGSTYGGNPLATGVANAVLDVLLAPGFIDGVRERGEYLKGQLEGLVKKHPKVYLEQRGTGFLQGLRCEVPAGDMVNRLQSLGLLVPPAGENVIRVFPALIADKAALDEGIDILSKAAQSFESAAQGANKAAE